MGLPADASGGRKQQHVVVDQASPNTATGKPEKGSMQGRQGLGSLVTHAGSLGVHVCANTMSDTRLGRSNMPAMSLDDIVRAVAESALSVEERLGFLDLCEARSADDLLADRTRVRSHLRVIETAVASGSALEGDLAGPVATTLIALLDDANEFSFVQRRVLAGAVEYFLQTDDADTDFGSDHGLADDARVVAAVCEALGRSDLALAVS